MSGDESLTRRLPRCGTDLSIAAQTAHSLMIDTQRLKRFFKHLRYQVRRGTLPFRRRGFSSFNEEQLLNTYLRELLPKNHSRTLVDIGAGDGRTGSNSLALLKQGWKGLAVEYDDRKFSKLQDLYRRLPNAIASQNRVTPDNVLALLAEYQIEKQPTMLSLDIDSYDYLVLEKILSQFRPRLIITEINEKIPPPIKFMVNYDPDFVLREHFFGYSIAWLEELCAKHGYALIDLEYNNAFLAPKELAGSRALTAEAAYRKGYLERRDRREKFHRNENMEALHSLSPEDGVKFIRQFFAHVSDKYDISI